MNKKIIVSLMASLLLVGVVGCSNAQSSGKKMDDKQTQQTGKKKMNMSNKEMKNMKSDDKK
ncbi:hypothetical protein [Neobacillus sp. PS3-40]|uniref:hypothetical protein n=1 Tax=Neobacillus sp. PS3-40 TaxID=3070679 RepID=UPI0027E1131E|nr:hypothetical protein [Neobacillus sp. PS3-40]WML44867.1 hypothetical protein RCG20_02880 [Neobacillus sp. PS3-40]